MTSAPTESCACPSCHHQPSPAGGTCFDCTAPLTTPLAGRCDRCGARRSYRHCERCGTWSFDHEWTTSDEALIGSRLGNSGASSVHVGVSGRSDFATISAAVAGAPDDARVIVESGVYVEAVRVDRKLEIVADGAVLWRSPDGEPCLTLGNATAYVDGIAFEGNAGEAGPCVLADDETEAWFWHCRFASPAGDALVARCATLFLRACLVSQSRRGIVIGSGAAVSGRKCTIVDCSEAAIATQGAGVFVSSEFSVAGGACVEASDAAVTRFLNCRMTNSRCGVVASGNAQPQLFGTAFVENELGVQLLDGSHVEMRDTFFCRNHLDLSLADAAEARIVEACSDGDTAITGELGGRTKLDGRRVTFGRLVLRDDAVALLEQGPAASASTSYSIGPNSRLVLDGSPYPAPGAASPSPPASADAAAPNAFAEALKHLEVLGSLNEAELHAMLGPRRSREFARTWELLAKTLPYRVRINNVSGQKVYVKDGGR